MSIILLHYSPPSQLVNYFGHQPHPPTHISSFLKERLTKAKKNVDNLAKSSYPGFNADVITKQLALKFELIPLELGKHKASITEGKSFGYGELPAGESFSMNGNNYRDVVQVTWPVSGSGDLLGLRDALGEVEQPTTRGQNVYREYLFKVGLSTNDTDKAAVKTRIEQATASINGHFIRINQEVASFNDMLTEELLPLVIAKLKTFDNHESAEDFLNS